jgi:hypothetical protein
MSAVKLIAMRVKRRLTAANFRYEKTFVCFLQSEKVAPASNESAIHFNYKRPLRSLLYRRRRRVQQRMKMWSGFRFKNSPNDRMNHSLVVIKIKKPSEREST